jgi:hypothetical protein
MFFREVNPVDDQEPVYKSRKVAAEADRPDQLSAITDLFKCSNTDVIVAAIRGWHEMSEADRIAIILAAVAGNRRECLRAFVSPQKKGGLGWGLDVENDQGETPLIVAAKHQNRALMAELIIPVEENGFGLELDKKAIRMLYQRNGMFPYSDMRYRRTKLTKADRQHSFIEYQGQRFVRNGQLGAGAFSVVSRFTSESDANQHIAVKQPQDKRKISSSPLKVLLDADYPNREISFFQILYPHLSPCRLQHYIDTEARIYDFREIMPVIQGVTCEALHQTIQTTVDLMKLILAIAMEVDRIHGMGIVHGDIKKDNIIIDAVKAVDGEIDGFVVILVDFETAGYIGARVDAFTSLSPHCAPDRQVSVNPNPVATTAQDVFSVAHLIGQVWQLFKARVDQTTASELYDFASVMAFAQQGLHINPDERPELGTFITLLKEEIAAAIKPVDFPWSPRMK